MLPRRHRLPGYRIPQLVHTGKRVKGSIATLLIGPQNQAKMPSRFAAVVPMRIAKKSVDRNRIKRLLYESLYTHLEELELGCDCIIMSDTPIQDKKLDDVQPLITQLLKNARFIQ